MYLLHSVLSTVMCIEIDTISCRYRGCCRYNDCVCVLGLRKLKLNSE